MDQGQILMLAVAGIFFLTAIVIWVAFRRRHTELLRERFGAEYDRAVSIKGNRARAEADLDDRTRRVEELEIRPLTVGEASTLQAEWEETKAIFVDSPQEAVLHADRTLTRMLQLRGFPMADFDRRYEDLTVDHGEVARHYREGHDVVLLQDRGEASTEDLRQAMRHYEHLFDEMIADTPFNAREAAPLPRMRETERV